MGWSTGSEIAEELWDDIKDYISEDNHQEVANKIFTAFENNDADDWRDGEDSLWAIARPDEYKEWLENE